MQESIKIGALIPIRLSSERLPGKALRTLGNRTVLENLLRRVKLSKFLKPEAIVICTTTEPEDDPLVESVSKYGIKLFRGSKGDIIDRFYECCKLFGFDAVIQIDGDDPCTDPFYMDLCMTTLLENLDVGIVTCEGLPLGMASKAFYFWALEKVWKSKLDEKNDTGFIYYFTKTSLFPVKVIKPVSKNHIHNTARLTLDYPEDLLFFEKLLEIAEYDNSKVACIDDIVNTLKQHPELIEINSYLDKKYWERTKQLINLHYKDLQGVRKIEI